MVLQLISVTFPPADTVAAYAYQTPALFPARQYITVHIFSDFLPLGIQIQHSGKMLSPQGKGMGRLQTPFGPDTFVVIEKWESPEALKAHAAAPHMAAYAAKTKEMIASRVIHVLSPAA